jgi:hypothetical protein
MMHETMNLKRTQYYATNCWYGTTCLRTVIAAKTFKHLMTVNLAEKRVELGPFNCNSIVFRSMYVYGSPHQPIESYFFARPQTFCEQIYVKTN